MQSHLLAKCLLEKAQVRDSKYQSMPALQPCGLSATESGEPPYQAKSSSLPRKKRQGQDQSASQVPDKEKDKKQRPSSAQLQRTRPQQEQQLRSVKEQREQQRDSSLQQLEEKQQQQKGVQLRNPVTQQPVRRVYEQAIPAPGISVTVLQEKFRLSLPPQGHKQLLQQQAFLQLQKEQQEAAASAPAINKEFYVPVNIKPSATTLVQQKGSQMTSFSPPPISQGSPVNHPLAVVLGRQCHSSPEVPHTHHHPHHHPLQGNPHSQAIFQFPPMVHGHGILHQPRVSEEDPMYDSGLCMCPPSASTHTDGTPVHPEWTQDHVQTMNPSSPAPVSPRNGNLPQYLKTAEPMYVSGLDVDLSCLV